MKNVFLIFIVSLLVIAINAIPSSNNNDPIAIHLDNQITTIISCKSRNKLKCDGLSVVAKLSNESVPYTNEIVLNKHLLPNRVTFRSFAASRIDTNSLVVTALSVDQQYFFVVGIQSTELKVIKTLEPILASSIRTTDITAIEGNQNEFYVVVDLINNKRKVARISNTAFDEQEIGTNRNIRDRSTITANNRGAFITHGGDCSNSRLLFVEFDSFGEINRCFKSQQNRCSESGRENIVFLNDTRAVWSFIYQDDAYFYYLNAPSSPLSNKSVNQKKIVSNERNWNLPSPSLFCDQANLIQNNFAINLNERITDLQLTLDPSKTPNELVVSFERRNNFNCNIEGYLYSVNADKTLQRIRDSNNQFVNLPSISCSALGFDRVLFDDEFILLRYESTKINLQNVFPNHPSL